MMSDITVEKERLCGWRKVGGLYIMGEGIQLPCSKMPYKLGICPVCGEGISFKRNYQWMNAKHLTGGRCDTPQPYCGTCPFEQEKTLLMFVGKSYYKKPIDFIIEALGMGVSKRVTTIPKGLEFGKTWILLAHIHGMEKRETVPAVGLVTTIDVTTTYPAIFYAFRPTHAEKIVTQKMYDDMSDEEKAKAEEKGIRFVIVPEEEKHMKRGHVVEEEPPAPEPVFEAPKKVSLWKRLRGVKDDK